MAVNIGYKQFPEFDVRNDPETVYASLKFIRYASSRFLLSTTGSLRYGHNGLQTRVIHGEDLVRDLLRMLDSTWVS